MSKRWFQPLTGIKVASESSPGPGWLTIVSMEMPDGRTIDSTLDDLNTWLKTTQTTYAAGISDGVLQITGDSSKVGRDLIPSILACRYFLAEEYDQDGYQAWFITYDYDATPYEGTTIEVFDDEPDPDVADITGGGGGGGGGGPPPEKPPPWDKGVPFPDVGPLPGEPVLPEPVEVPDDPSKPISEIAKEQADSDLGMIPDPDGDIQHPDGAPSDKKGDCQDCGGTGEIPSDDGSGDEEGDDGEDGEGDDGDDGEGDNGDDGEGDDEEGEGSGSESDECGTCGGTGEMPSDEGEDGDDGDDGDDGEGDEEEDEGEGDELPEDEVVPDDPYDPAPVVEAANRAIDAANRAIQSNDETERSLAVDECFQAVKDCQQSVDHRSTTQRQVLQRALDAAQAALEVAS